MSKITLVVSLLSTTLAIAQDVKSDEWKTKLQSIIGQHDSTAKVTVEGGSYIYRYHTQTFKIHAIDKTGTISETAHDEEGPKVDGVFMQLTLQDGSYRGAADIPQDLKMPYWTVFINAYPVSTGKHLLLNLSYGSRADKKLLEAIKTCFGPVLPSVSGTAKNPIGFAAEPPSVPSPAKPYSYGSYLTATCRRVEGAGRFPISYSEHEVTAINGQKLATAFRTQIEFIDGFNIPGNGEVVVSGYFTQKEIGSPSWPKDAPERGYMEVSQFKFDFVDFFIATGVRAPEDSKERFEREVVNKRKK